MTDYHVIVCGLGPVGQLLALLLGDRGVKTLVVDRLHEPHPVGCGGAGTPLSRITRKNHA